MWIRDISWCLEVLDGRSVMFFFGRQENNADIDDGKDVTKDVSAESAEDSGQNLQVCLLGKLFWIQQCKSCSFWVEKTIKNCSISLSRYFPIAGDKRKMQRRLRVERSLDEKVRCKKVKTWLCRVKIRSSYSPPKIHSGFISVGGLWSCVLGSSEWIEEMSSCETIFNLANTMMGSGWGANFSHISTENVWTRWRDTPGFFGVLTFCLNNTQVVLKVSKQNSQTTQAVWYVHYSWFMLIFLLTTQRIPFMFEYIVVHLGKTRVFRLVRDQTIESKHSTLRILESSWGVLAVPYAFRLTSYWAIPLLLLVVAVPGTSVRFGKKFKPWRNPPRR